MKELTKDNPNQIVLFSLDEHHYALLLSTVERVINSVEITPLPKAPEIVTGVINYHGDIIPVIDMRKRFNLPSRELKLEDQFIIARTSKRFVVIAVDSVDDVHDLKSHQVLDANEIFPYTDYLSGIAKIEGEIVLINDLDKFLSLDEISKLEEALAGEEK